MEDFIELFDSSSSFLPHMWSISEHVDFQLNQNICLVLTYYKPSYGGIYAEIHIKSINLPHVGEVNTLQMGVMSLQ
jgi:hypothetical protein